MIPLSKRVPRQIQSKKRAPITLPFGEWLPDLADYRNPGCTNALNVIPAADGFRPMPDKTVQSDALDATALGAFAARDTSGNVSVYAGDATKLYALSNQSFSDISKSGGYSTATGSAWEFTLFGQTVIATNYDDAVQSIGIGGSQFADLITGTNKPRARRVGTVRDHLVLGDTFDSTDGTKPERVWWSAINDATDFDPSASTLSDYQDQPDGGAVKHVEGGVEYGMIFQENAITRMTFVGSPLVFRFDKIDRQRGTPIPGSVIGHGRMVYFISEEGFFVNDGTRSNPIGQNKVDKEFWDQFEVENADGVSAAIDAVNKLVVWAFPGSGSTGGVPNKLYLFDWVNNRWSSVDMDVQFVLRTLTQGYTLDGLDAVGNLDALPYSLDSRAWVSGDLRLSAFDTDNKLNFFDGSNLAATIETALRDIGMRSKVQGFRPLVDGGTVTGAVASKAKLTDTASFATAVAENSNGYCPQISEGRYHKFQVNIAAGGTWTKAQGVEIDGAPTGNQ
jgi:hypothetical protein